MTQNVTLTYIFDPLCGWCYGASAGIETLAQSPSVDVRPIPSGLFAGPNPRPLRGFAAQAWAMDQRIGSLSGQRFSEAYRRDVLGADDAFLDSTVATRAVVAVSEDAPDRVLEVLRVIQTERYVGGKDITSATVVAGLLEDIGLQDAAARVLTAEPSLLQAVEQRTREGEDLMATYGLRGVPSLLAVIDGKTRVLDASALYANADVLIDSLLQSRAS